MNRILTIIILSVFIFNCKNDNPETKISNKQELSIVGDWDNFQQYWLENTAEDKHRVDTDDKHRHLSLNVRASGDNDYTAEIREGRNGKDLVETIIITNSDLRSDAFKMDGDTLYISGKVPFENKDAYRFVRVRKFSGWIEYPMESAKDGMYHQGNLIIHDQGGMAELDIEGVDYTVELTQLLFAKKLAIMKLAIYDMPLDSVGINSRSISYTWLNPSARRTGINLRKVITGWTFIEPGYVNQNTWRKEEK